MFYVTDLAREYAEWMKAGGYPDLRFGQYICNKYLNSCATCPNIFYEEDDGRAFEKIYTELSRG